MEKLGTYTNGWFMSDIKASREDSGSEDVYHIKESICCEGISICYKGISSYLMDGHDITQLFK